jgi:DNA repair protein RecO (recombination protein O)
MITKTKAIVLRNTNYGESSVISKMYTREFGVRTYILQSIRKGKSAIKPSMIQPLSLVDLDIYEKPNSSINRIKELKNNPLLMDIQDSVPKKTVALFLLELLNQCIVEEQYEEELFDFIAAQIIFLEREPLNALFPINFMLRLTYYLGIEPQGEFSIDTPYLSLEEGIFLEQSGVSTVSKEISELISLLANNSNWSLISINSDLRREGLNQLIKYYQYHITKNKKMKSVEILSELLRL